MAKVYLNWKGPASRETVDCVAQESGQSAKEFRFYVAAMCREYRLAGMDVYQSSRPCANWKEN